MKRIHVNLRGASYDVLIAHNLLRDAGSLISGAFEAPPSLSVVITSARIWRLWGERLEKSLRGAKLRHAVLEIPDGETHKNIRSIESLMKAMTSAGADRRSLVVAFGGGVVGDVAGFAASIYMRGIPVVQIPTTLLAQVDAAVGGKTGVNLPAGKNLVGTFHQPKLVLIDPDLLSTLSDREYRAGFYEVIKCGIIRNARLFGAIESAPERIGKREPQLLMQSIIGSVKIKAEVVSRDEREGDLRRILNFGHTIGHALEADGGYKTFLHGEAVGWGMVAASKIGAVMGVTPGSVDQRITNLILRAGTLPPVTVSADNVLRLIQSDKKTVHGSPNFVLATAIGKTTISNKVPMAVIRDTLAELRGMSPAAR